MVYAPNGRLSSEQLRSLYLPLRQQPRRTLPANVAQLFGFYNWVGRAVREYHRLIELQVLAKVLDYVVALVCSHQHAAVI